MSLAPATDPLARAAHRAAAVAARALSDLAADPGPVVVPRLERLEAGLTSERRRALGTRPVVLSLTYSGTARGALFLVLSAGSARRLLARLDPGSGVRLRRLTTLQRSALKESANVALCAWLASMSGPLGPRLIPAPPELRVVSPGDAEGGIAADEECLLAEIRLVLAGAGPAGRSRRASGEIRGILVSFRRAC